MSNLPTPSNALGQVTRETILSTPKALGDYLDKNKGLIAMALPEHLKPERFIRTILTAFSTNPALRRCTAFSILQSAVVASQIGLEIGVTGQGYLVPYGQNCTFVPGWQGLVGLLNNSGMATAWTGAVYEGDVFEWELGASPRCLHKPGDLHGEEGKMTHVYAVGRVKGQDLPIIEVWTIGRVERHRNKINKVGNRHYSFGNMEMYARKVVLLQVLKYLPRSIRLNNGLIAANASEAGRVPIVEDGVVIDIDGAEVNPSGDLASAASSVASQEPEAAPVRRGRPPKAAAQDVKPPNDRAPDPEPVKEMETNPPAANEEPEFENPIQADTAPSDSDIRKGLYSELRQLLTENQIADEDFQNAAIEAHLIGVGNSITSLSTDRLRKLVEQAGFVIESIIASQDS